MSTTSVPTPSVTWSSWSPQGVRVGQMVSIPYLVTGVVRSVLYGPHTVTFSVVTPGSSHTVRGPEGVGVLSVTPVPPGVVLVTVPRSGHVFPVVTWE